jgi:hypothetical protein
VRMEFNQPVQHVSYFWDGVRRRDRPERNSPYFIGGDHRRLESGAGGTGSDVLRFGPLSVPGNHTLRARTAIFTETSSSSSSNQTTTPHDFTITFQIIQKEEAKQYRERVLINAGTNDDRYLSHPDRSYSFGIDHRYAAALDIGNAKDLYNLSYFRILRKSEYRGGGVSGRDFPILYTVRGLRPNALHRITVGFVETEPAYCSGQRPLLRKTYFIFCNEHLFGHAYTTLQYVPCDMAHVAHGYFPSTDQGMINVAFLSKLHPFETTVALVDIELFHINLVV